MDLSLLLAQLHLNEQEQRRQRSLPGSFDSPSSPSSDPTSSLITTSMPSTSTGGRYLTNSLRRPLCSSLSMPETPANYPVELLTNGVFSNNNVDDQPCYVNNNVDEFCHSLNGLSLASQQSDRRCYSLGDVLAPLGSQIFPPGAACNPSPSSPSSQSSVATSAARYKTELCRPFEEHGTCRYGSKCQFAHGRAELRNVSRHPKYKTDLCRTYHSTGLCPYGPRCHFVHNEEERGTEILYTAGELQKQQRQQQWRQKEFSPDAAELIRQRQLLQQQLAAATAIDFDKQLARRRAVQLDGLHKQLSVFESDEDDLPDDLLIRGGPSSRLEGPRGSCPTSTRQQQLPWDLLPLAQPPQQQSMTRRVSVADPLHHFQQQKQQQPRSTRIRSLGLNSPPGFEAFAPASAALFVSGAARSIGSTAESSSISSAASSISGGDSRSTSPSHGLFLADDPIWQRPAVAPSSASAVAAETTADWGFVDRSSSAETQVGTDKLLEALLSKLSQEKILDLLRAVSATSQRDPVTAAAALSTVDVSAPPSTDSWMQQPFASHYGLPVGLTAAQLTSTRAVW